MAGNVLWTSVFNKPDSQSQELTRQRIKQEEVCGRRPASIVPGPVHAAIVRGKGDHVLLDPWQPSNTQRQSVNPPLVGYGGTFPRLRPEHTGVNRGEQAAKFTVPDRESVRKEAPAGGASALGTKPLAVPGTRSARAASSACIHMSPHAACVCMRCEIR